MNGFERDLFSEEDYDLICLAGGYKYSVLGDKCFVLEGHRGIVKYEREQVCFRLKNKEICVKGKELTIKQMTKNFAVLEGKIVGVEIIGD